MNLLISILTLVVGSSLLPTYPKASCPPQKQKGIVYLNKMDGKPVRKVEIIINGNGGCLSDDNGYFTLPMSECPGSKVSIQINKAGYDIVNQIEVQNHILKNIYEGSDLQFTLIISPSNDIYQHREEYYRNYFSLSQSYKVMQDNLKRQNDEIKRLQDEKKKLEINQLRAANDDLKFKSLTKEISILSEKMAKLSENKNSAADLLSKKEEEVSQLAKVFSTISTSDVDTSYNKAFILFSQGNYSEVQKILSSSLLDSELDNLNNEREELHRREEERKKRERNWLNKALLKASGFQSTGDSDSTIYWFKRALLIDSTNYSTLFSLAVNLQKANKDDQAIVYYQKALVVASSESFEKNKSDIYNNLGVLYWRKKNLVKSVESLEKAIEIREKLYNNKSLSGFFWFQSSANLYSFLNRSGNLDKANQVMNSQTIAGFNEMAADWIRNPPKKISKKELAQALGNLSWYNLLNKNYKQAESLSKKGIALDPSQQWIETNLAHALLMQDEIPEATIVYERLMDKGYTNGHPLTSVLADDFIILKKAGLVLPDIPIIRTLLIEK